MNKLKGPRKSYQANQEISLHVNRGVYLPEGVFFEGVQSPHVELFTQNTDSEYIIWPAHNFTLPFDASLQRAYNLTQPKIVEKNTIHEILYAVIAREGVVYVDEGWVDEDDYTQGREGADPYEVIEDVEVSGYSLILDFNEGDVIIELGYTLKSPLFYWSKNTPGETYFKWQGKTWRPLYGSSPILIGTLGDTLVESVDQVPIIPNFKVGDEPTEAVDFLLIESDAERDPGTNVIRKNGSIEVDSTLIEEHRGKKLWFIPDTYRETSTPLTIDYIAPVPSCEYPLIRAGAGTYLEVLMVDDDVALEGLDLRANQAGVSFTTGKLKIETEEKVYYDGVAMGTGVLPDPIEVGACAPSIEFQGGVEVIYDDTGVEPNNFASEPSIRPTGLGRVFKEKPILFHAGGEIIPHIVSETIPNRFEGGVYKPSNRTLYLSPATVRKFKDQTILAQPLRCDLQWRSGAIWATRKILSDEDYCTYTEDGVDEAEWEPNSIEILNGREYLEGLEVEVSGVSTVFPARATPSLQREAGVQVQLEAGFYQAYYDQDLELSIFPIPYILLEDLPIPTAQELSWGENLILDEENKRFIWYESKEGIYTAQSLIDYLRFDNTILEVESLEVSQGGAYETAQFEVQGSQIKLLDQKGSLKSKGYGIPEAIAEGDVIRINGEWSIAEGGEFEDPVYYEVYNPYYVVKEVLKEFVLPPHLEVYKTTTEAIVGRDYYTASFSPMNQLREVSLGGVKNGIKVTTFDQYFDTFKIRISNKVYVVTRVEEFSDVPQAIECISVGESKGELKFSPEILNSYEDVECFYQPQITQTFDLGVNGEHTRPILYEKVAFNGNLESGSFSLSEPLNAGEGVIVRFREGGIWVTKTLPFHKSKTATRLNPYIYRFTTTEILADVGATVYRDGVRVTDYFVNGGDVVFQSEIKAETKVVVVFADYVSEGGERGFEIGEKPDLIDYRMGDSSWTLAGDYSHLDERLMVVGGECYWLSATYSNPSTTLEFYPPFSEAGTRSQSLSIQVCEQEVEFDAVSVIQSLKGSIFIHLDAQVEEGRLLNLDNEPYLILACDESGKARLSSRLRKGAYTTKRISKRKLYHESERRIQLPRLIHEVQHVVGFEDLPGYTIDNNGYLILDEPIGDRVVHVSLTHSKLLSEGDKVRYAIKTQTLNQRDGVIRLKGLFHYPQAFYFGVNTYNTQGVETQEARDRDARLVDLECKQEINQYHNLIDPLDQVLETSCGRPIDRLAFSYTEALYPSPGQIDPAQNRVVSHLPFNNTAQALGLFEFYQIGDETEEIEVNTNFKIDEIDDVNARATGEGLVAYSESRLKPRLFKSFLTAGVANIGRVQHRVANLEFFNDIQVSRRYPILNIIEVRSSSLVVCLSNPEDFPLWGAEVEGSAESVLDRNEDLHLNPVTIGLQLYHEGEAITYNSEPVVISSVSPYAIQVTRLGGGAVDYGIFKGIDKIELGRGDTSTEFSDPPTLEQLEELATLRSDFIQGLDYQANAQGLLTYVQFPTGVPLQTMLLQSPPQAGEALDLSYSSYSADPLHLPALRSESLSDDGDLLHHLRFNERRYLKALLREVSLIGEVDYEDQKLYPVEIVATCEVKDEAEGDCEVAVLCTATDLLPFSNGSEEEHDLRPYDLALIKAPQIMSGWATVARVSLRGGRYHVELPRFATDTASPQAASNLTGSTIRYDFKNAMVWLQEGAYPADPQVNPPSGVYLIEDSNSNKTILRFDLPTPIHLNNGFKQGEGNLNDLWSHDVDDERYYNVIRVDLIARADPNIVDLPGGLMPDPGEILYSFVLTESEIKALDYGSHNENTVALGEGDITFGTKHPAPEGDAILNNEIIIDGVGLIDFSGLNSDEWFIPYSDNAGVKISLYGYEFAISINTYNYNALKAKKGGSKTGFLSDRVDFNEVVDLRFSKERDFSHPLSNLNLESQLRVHEVKLGDYSSDVTNTDFYYTFPSRLDSGLMEGDIAGSWIGATLDSPERSTITIPSIEEYENIPIFTQNLTVSFIPSTNKNETEIILDGEGVITGQYLTKIDVANGAVSNVRKGDLLIVKPPSLHCGTYVIRRAVAGNLFNQRVYAYKPDLPRLVRVVDEEIIPSSVEGFAVEGRLFVLGLEVVSAEYTIEEGRFIDLSGFEDGNGGEITEDAFWRAVNNSTNPYISGKTQVHLNLEDVGYGPLSGLVSVQVGGFEFTDPDLVEGVALNTLRIVSHTPADNTTFVEDESAVVYSNVPHYLDFTNVTQWGLIHEGPECLLPDTRITVTFNQTAGIFIEPSTPASYRDYGLSDFVVDASHDLDDVGFKAYEDYLGVMEEVPEPPPIIDFEVRRIRRWAFETLNRAIWDYRRTLEILKFTVDSCDFLSNGFIKVTSTGTQFGAFDSTVEVGDWIGSYRILKVEPGSLILTPGPLLEVGGEYEIYKQKNVPVLQSCQQLFETVFEVIHETKATNLIGGKCATKNALEDSTPAAVLGFPSLGVEVGDLVVIDPAGVLGTGERGAPPQGDKGVIGEVGFVAGKVSRLDDNRGFYRVVEIIDEEPPDGGFIGGLEQKLILDGTHTFTETIDGYNFLPSVSSTDLGQAEGRNDLRLAQNSAGGTFTGSPRSIQPFSYKVVRPKKAYSNLFIDFVLFMRERALSMLDLVEGVSQGGTYYLFQKYEQIKVTNGGFEQTLLQDLISNITNTPYVNSKTCLSLLDRMVWVGETLLEKLTYNEGIEFGANPYVQEEIANLEYWIDTVVELEGLRKKRWEKIQDRLSVISR